jgi:hypothetical protein
VRLRTAITAALLLFVVASIAAPIVRYLALSRRTAGDTLAPSRSDCVIVLYLRGNVRCAACQTLEACSREVVEGRFAAEASEGRIAWQAIDYQAAGNEHFTGDFQLVTGGVVLVKFRDGRAVGHRALAHAWNMTDDRDGLIGYLEESIRAFEKGGP